MMRRAYLSTGEIFYLNKERREQQNEYKNIAMLMEIKQAEINFAHVGVEKNTKNVVAAISGFLGEIITYFPQIQTEMTILWKYGA